MPQPSQALLYRWVVAQYSTQRNYQSQLANKQQPTVHGKSMSTTQMNMTISQLKFFQRQLKAFTMSIGLLQKPLLHVTS